MKVAMFLKFEKSGVRNENLIHVLIFEITNHLITGVEKDFLYGKSINYISLWALNKQIRMIYVDEVDEKTKAYFNRLGIIIKRIEELDNKELFQVFLD